MNFINTLGWTLLHFLWQGTFIALMLATVHLLLRGASARIRYAVACGAMLLMLGCAVATFLYISTGGAGIMSTGVFITEVLSPTLASPIRAVATIPAAPAMRDFQIAALPATSFSGVLTWLVYFWMGGVALLTVRSLGGWMALQSLRRRDARLAEPIWQQRMARLAQRLQISRAVRLCESTIAQVPAVIGWVRPMVLLPVCALSGLPPEQLEGLLAHELAHIRRHDYLINLLQTCVETVLFYHPAVWWVGSRIRTERENCCDDLAVQVCGDALAYAKALTQLEQLRGGIPSLAMAANGGSLLHRVQRLLSSRQPARVAPMGWIAGMVLTLIAVTAWASPRLAHSGGLRIGQGEQSPGSGPFVRSAAGAGAARRMADPSVLDDAKHALLAISLPQAIAGAEPTPQADPQSNEHEAAQSGFLEEIDRAGYHNTTVDQLIALKIQGVDADYIRGIRAEGYEPTIDELLALKIQGVTPQYIEQFKSRQWKLDIDELLAFRIHGVDPIELEKMSALGYKLDADEALAMRIHGVTPELASKTKELGLGMPSFDQILAMRIHGADVQFVTGMKEAGVSGLDLDNLVALKIHGADPARIKEFAELGFKDLSTDEVVELCIFGVTPEFIRQTQKRGFKNLTLEQILDLKRYGILNTQESN